MNNNFSDALVLFGATGDLSSKKIFPALQSMVKRGRLNCPVIGIARRPWSDEDFKGYVRENLVKHKKFDPEAFEKLAPLLRYVSGNYHDAETFQKLRRVLGNAQRPLYYLAIPPSLFTTVTEFLAQSGCSKGARIVLEKPFGRDFKTAQELNKTLHKYFPEESLFRIDHYLGKEPIQNLFYFRSANPHLEAIWNKTFIEYVEINMAESFGVEGRGSFYEEAGAIRDVVQNHMLQVIACLAMEIPDITDGNSIRDERTRLLKSILPVNPRNLVRGQYQGYREEHGVSPESNIETFAAVRFDINNDRWCGVPFYVRAGKKLPVTVTEVKITLKRPVNCVKSETTPSDYFRFRISPDVIMALATNVKKPGEELTGRQIELIACNQSPEQLEAYDRLLGDAIQGDETLYGREDAIEASWCIVDRILSSHPPLPYEPGSWGPSEAKDILPPNIQWSTPSDEKFCDT